MEAKRPMIKVLSERRRIEIGSGKTRMRDAMREEEDAREYDVLYTLLITRALPPVIPQDSHVAVNTRQDTSILRATEPGENYG